jgi:hypothetical protein
MGRPQNVEMVDDPEYTEFTNYLEEENRLSYATKKSYKTSYRKLRNLLGKNVADTAQDTTSKAIMASTDNINSAQALINIAIIVREKVKQMPTEELVEQRTTNKAEVTETLKQANLFTELPSLEELDQFIETLWKQNKYRDYICNYLIRYYYVRNQDLGFDIVETKKETLEDQTKNWLWLDRKNQRVNYIRNNYKTFKTYGQKVTVITNERFLRAVKVCNRQMYAFPITTESDKLGYYIQKMTLNQIGEGKMLKAVINHYRDDISKLKEISQSRGTNLEVLLTSYNINYDH